MFIELAGHDKNRKQRFLEEMEREMPWDFIEEEISKYWSESKYGRKKYPLKKMLKIHCLQQWYGLGDPTVEAELYDSIAFRRFVGINDFGDEIPDETSILRFRRFLEEHELQKEIFEGTKRLLAAQGALLKEGTIVDATIIKASSSTKNKEKKRDPEMSSTRKNNNYFFGAKQHIGVDIHSGLIHSIETTTARVHDSKMLEQCLHGEEQIISGDKAYGNKALKKKMRKEGKVYMITEKKVRGRSLSPKQKKWNNKISRVRGKVEHAFGIIKNLWKHRTCRYKGLKKNNLQWNFLATLANFYMVARYKRFRVSG